MNDKIASENIEKSKDFNIFIANSIYPNAEEIFTSKFKSLKEIKDDCFVIIDTNALLVPYTVNKESLEEIKKTYQILSKENRLVVPAQAAREFARNRANKISELYSKLESKRDSLTNIETGKYPLLDSIEKYNEVLELEKQINDLLKKYRNSINDTLEGILGWTWNDPVSELYGEIFSGTVLDIEINEESIKKELLNMQIHKIPPGYKDSSKSDEGIGDYLIWKTILKIGSEKKKDVLFVSGDEKPDWWHQSNKKPLYPRYELLDEFRRESDGGTFHITSFSKFLNLFGASDKVVKDVRSNEVVMSLPSAKFYGGEIKPAPTEMLIKDIITIWFASRFPKISIQQNSNADLLLSHENSFHTDVNIILLKSKSDRFEITAKIGYSALKLSAISDESKNRTFPLLVAVGADFKTGTELYSEATSRSEELEEFCSLLVGHINEAGAFAPLYLSNNLFSYKD